MASLTVARLQSSSNIDSIDSIDSVGRFALMSARVLLFLRPVRATASDHKNHCAV